MSSPTTAPVNTETPGVPPPQFRRDLSFIAYAVFIIALTQSGGIGEQPIKYWLRDHFHRNDEQIYGFFFLTGLAWCLKPLFGLMTDAFPLWGTRRRWYMIVSSLLAAVAWGLVSLGQGRYDAFLIGTFILSTFLVIMSTIMGAVFVEIGQRHKATGRVSALNSIGMGFPVIISGYLGGLLTKQAFGMTVGICAALLLTLAVAAHRFLPEFPTARRDTEVWTRAKADVKLCLASRPLWAATALLLLFNLSPDFSNPLWSLQKDTLKSDTQLIGILKSVDGIGLVVGGMLYGQLCRRFELRTLLFAGIICQCLAALMFLHYHPTHQGAILIEFVALVLNGVSIVSLYDLATRAAPRGSAGLGYGLMMSVRDFAMLSAGLIGGSLSNAHVPLNTLIRLNAGTTFLCLFLIPFLPSVLVRRREGDDLSTVHTTSEQASV